MVWFLSGLCNESSRPDSPSNSVPCLFIILLHFVLDVVDSLVDVGMGVLDPGVEVVRFDSGCGFLEQFNQACFEMLAQTQCAAEAVCLELALAREYQQKNIEYSN